MIVEQMRQADVLVFATPIYFYEMSGQMKTLLDRTNPLFPGEYAFRDIYLLAASADEEASSMDVQESDLQRASKILRTEFGSDWKQIVQTLGTRELTHCVGQDLTSFMAFPERAEGGSNQWRGNCSPQVVAKLIQFVKKCRRYEKNKDFLFLDPMSGSGTSHPYV